MAFYNPRSASRPHQFGKALAILRAECGGDCLISFARDVSKPGQQLRTVPLSEATPEMADMRTVVIVGNRDTRQHRAPCLHAALRPGACGVIEPMHNLLHTREYGAGGHPGSVDQNDRNAQRASGVQLGPGAPVPPAFFATMRSMRWSFNSAVSPATSKGPRAITARAFWQRQRTFGRVHQAQQVMVLRLGGKDIEVLLADRQEHPRRGYPAAPPARLQDRARRASRPPSPACQGARSNPARGIPARAQAATALRAHLRGERVGCIDYARAYPLAAQKRGQPIHPAKAAHPRGQGLRNRARPCARHRRTSASIAPFRQGPRQGRGFAGAAQNKDLSHG